jgi:hypothetical protein
MAATRPPVLREFLETAAGRLRPPRQPEQVSTVYSTVASWYVESVAVRVVSESISALRPTGTRYLQWPFAGVAPSHEAPAATTAVTSVS